MITFLLSQSNFLCEDNMNRMKYILAAVLPAALAFSMVDAHAQRKNTTNHDVKPAYQAETTDTEKDLVLTKDNDGKMKMHKKDGEHRKKGCKHYGKHDFSKEINENYNEAISAINKSDFTDDQKAVLVRQAKENRDISLAYAEKIDSTIKSQMTELKKAGIDKKNIHEEKANKKAIKKVKKLLFID